MIRKPESQRGPQLARRAKATAGGTVARTIRFVVPWVALGPGPRARPSSPRLTSTLPGNRIARIVAITKRTNA